MIIAWLKESTFQPMPEILMSLRTLSKLLVSLSFFACTSLFATPLVVNVAGIQSVGDVGNADNTVLNFQVGANSHITSVSYSVNVTAFTPSWLSELGLQFTDSDQGTGVIFTAGGDNNAGTASYADSADLAAIGLDFFVGADGILRLEFFEDFDDFAGADGQWNFGTVTFGVTEETPPPGNVPEPATGLLLGAGLALMAYSRRRRTANAAK
jgi:hypothetical protein